MRLLLISLDALSREDAPALLSLPAFSALAARGVFCDQVQTAYPALTYPIHATIITGCWPERHGIGHNQPFQPDVPPGRRAWYWTRDCIRVPTLHDAAHAAGWDVASVLWPITGKTRAIRRNFPEVVALPGENQALKMIRHGTAWWVLQTELRYGRARKSTREPDLDDYAALLARKLIEGKTPDLLTLHLIDCDEMRHLHGTHSAQAAGALRRLDARVGALTAALAKKNLLDDTVVALVSDHGQADIAREWNLDRALREAGLPARAQSAGFGAYIHPAPGEAARVEAALRANAAAWPIARVYGAQELRAMHAAPDVCLAVEAAAGTRLTDAPGEPAERATHGFGPAHPGSQCLFLAAGGPFARGKRVARMRMIDVAPTLARAAGLSLPGAQGEAVDCFE